MYASMRGSTLSMWRTVPRRRRLARVPARLPPWWTIARVTDSGIELEPVYGEESLATWDGSSQLGEPGAFPFTRGPYPSMYQRRLWTMRQYAGMGTAEDTNRRFRYLLEHGQTGLSVAFDLPTQMGLDSDHPRAEGEVGKTGVAIDSVEDMRRLFEEIPLDQVSTSMTINATAPILLLLYELVAEEQGIAPAALKGHRPERHPEGVRGARHVHLPAQAFDAADHRPLRLLRRADPPVEHHLDQRLPHARGRGDGRPGGRVHAGERHRVRPSGARRGARGGRVRPAPVVLLRLPHELLRGDREVPRGPPPVGADHARALRRPG